MIRKLTAALIGVLVAGFTLTVPVAAQAAPASGPLTCTATSTYYNYAVTGTMTMPDLPGAITVVTTHHSTVAHYSNTYTAITNVTPILDTAYAGGAPGKAGLNAWSLGTSAVDHIAYWLLLPYSPLGVVSKGQIVANTGTSLPIGCQAPAATGNTGAFTCSVQVKTIAYTVAGTIAAPENPTDVSVTNRGVVQGSHLTPVLDNTFSGGYWLSHYSWNAWDVQTDTAGNQIWLLIPNTPLSRSFDGMIYVQYANGAGNNQLLTTCTFT